MATNGRLELYTLTQVDGWAYLAPPTAASWNAACAEMVRIGYPRPAITAPDGAYRTFARQVYWKAYWTARGKPGNAATPGYSNHGWGTAVDIWNVTQFYRPDLLRVFASYGFTFNVPSELWHAKHDGSWPSALAGGDITPISPDRPVEPIPEEEDEMKTIQIHYTENGRTTRALVTPGTAYFVVWSETAADIANGLAKVLETGSSVEVTRSVFERFQQVAAKLEPKA